jgi:hypothetical protein
MRIIDDRPLQAAAAPESERQGTCRELRNLAISS